MVKKIEYFILVKFYLKNLFKIKILFEIFVNFLKNDKLVKKCINKFIELSLN